MYFFFRKKYTSGPRYWNVPVLVNTGTFLVYHYCLKMWYLRSLERAGVIQKLTILEHKNGLVLSNTCVPVSVTWSILFHFFSIGLQPGCIPTQQPQTLFMKQLPHLHKRGMCYHCCNFNPWLCLWNEPIELDHNLITDRIKPTFT